ncbi:glycosyl hydrolase family 18 protein [Heliophilum fasciatum]|uniref:Glycosyl hydrolase family 18 (Putative chitinase) n=1 Tax=Heliophilum fasciatum TaxID=35700 RepID=A0A4R2RNK5_9FIRM|nr:glycosyl hydrolase family 18 protein [Heliophilum fasciatum]MCW2279344.1 spore germination protein YaaH [Heliophilum fasciatum]TCP60775.1 glycosyl hydrolase family 18 (putative chitinase) [Heliophilum fasciatum]
MQRKLSLALSLLLAFMMLMPLPAMAAKKVTKTGTASSKIILGYYPVDYIGDKSAYNSLVNYGASFNAISTFTYKVDSLGNITGTPPTDGLTLAKSKSLKAYALIHNFINGGFDTNTATALLSSTTARQNLINQLKTTLPKYGYAGVNVDIENVPASCRSNYTQLIKEMKAALSPLNLKVIVSTPGKVYNDTTSNWGGAFDFAALGQYADYIQIMTYDEHYYGGTPGAVASIGYVTKAVQYTLTTMPKTKVLLGIATYGYDWYGPSTKVVNYFSVPKLLTQYNITPKWDDLSKTPWFTYTDSVGLSHQVWYENAQSTAYKLDLVNQYGLAGVGIWRLGFEDQSFWNTVSGKLK